MILQKVFAGSQELEEVLDGSVSQDGIEKIVTGVKDGLSRLIKDQVVSLPDELRRPEEGGYARRLLYRSPEQKYEVIAMIWGPGQGTPLHDHAGIWCVEGVLEGQIAVTQFDLVQREGELYYFREEGTVKAGCGMTGTLIPPFEYHTIHNCLPDTSSITLHVYGGQMDHCTVFEPVKEGWYRRHRKELAYS